MLAEVPEPPYVAVIFTTVASADPTGYAEMAERMEQLAGRQPGFLGVDSVRGADGRGITVSYWTDEAAVRAWRADEAHTAARRLGRDRWYDRYTLRVAEVTRARTWSKEPSPAGQSEPSPTP